jgi:hypothetical protein
MQQQSTRVSDIPFLRLFCLHFISFKAAGRLFFQVPLKVDVWHRSGDVMGGDCSLSEGILMIDSVINVIV